MLTEIILLIVLLLLSGLFSGSETALTTVTRYKVSLYVKQKRRGSPSLGTEAARNCDAISEARHVVDARLLPGQEA